MLTGQPGWQSLPALPEWAKHSGEVQRGPFTSEDYLSQLDGVAVQLNAGEGGAVRFDRRSLSALVVGFLEFVEMALGIKVGC